MARDLSPLFKAFGKRAEAVAKKVGPLPQPAMKVTLDAEWIAIARIVVEQLAPAVFALSAALGKSGEAHTEKVIESTTRVMIAEGALEVGFNLPDKRAAALIAKGGTRLLGIDVAGQTRTQVFRTMAEARQKGYGTEKLARLIRDQVGGGPWRSPQTRAKVIARTETKWAQNQSTIEATEASGVKYVVAVDDQIGHGDEDCAARNGEIFKVREAAAIEDHPNGTLLWLPYEGTPPA